nr:MAG TPA: hypothetical protein [Microviridae sp.]
MRRSVIRKSRIVSHNATPGVRLTKAKVYNLDDYRFGRGRSFDVVDNSRRRLAYGILPILGNSSFGSLRSLSSFPLDLEITSSRHELAEGFIDNRYFAPSRRYDVQSEENRSIARKALVLSPSVHLAPSGQLLEPSGRFFDRLGFSVPQQVLVCVRRKQRRQVLFAKGKSGSGNRKPRWNANSYIWC